MQQKKILDVAKRRGFFWQSALIHGGLSGFYDYGHNGTLIKRKLENLWRDYFLGLDDNYYEIESSIILPKEVFQSSGHLTHFVDPIVKCKKCGNTERADHILEEELKENFEGLSPNKLMKLIKKHKIKCEECGGQLEKVEELNMMFPVEVGTGSGAQEGYLNPETAQGAYLNFNLEFQALRKQLPLGLAIIGKAFRNEISPRNSLIRMREFSQAELQIFFDPERIEKHPKFEEVKDYKLILYPVKNRKKKNEIEKITCSQAVKKLKLPKFYVYHLAKVQQFYLDLLGLPEERFRLKQLSEEEKAFYNKYHWDVEIQMNSLGVWKEVAGVHYRTDHDLEGHQKFSGKKLEVNVEGKKFIPHVLELSFGVDRNIYALLDVAYDEEEKRKVLRFPRKVSPFDAGIFPLVSKDGLPEKAKETKNLLEEAGFNVFYDESGSIGRRYRRIDEIGVPAGITIDYDSKEQEDCTLRDRDSMDQVRVKINDLPETLRKFIQGEKLEKLGKIL